MSNDFNFYRFLNREKRLCYKESHFYTLFHRTINVT